MSDSARDLEYPQLAKIVEQICVCSTYSRYGAIVLERSELVDDTLAIGELVRAAKRFEDDEVKLVEVRLVFPDSTR